MDRATYILAELIGRDDPEVRSLVWAANNPSMRSAVPGLMRSLAYRRGIDPDNPPAFGFSDDLQGGDLILGRVKVGDNLHQSVGLADKGKSPGHTAIVGQSERGKSVLAKHIAAQAIKRGDKILALARDNEWRDLPALFSGGVVLYMEPKDIGINVLEVPKGPDGQLVMSPEDWVLQQKVVFRASVYTRDVSGNMLSRAIMKLYQEKDVFKGGDYPCLSELREEVDALSLGVKKRLGEARDTLLDRLDMLIQFLSGCDVVRSRDIHKLFSHSIILDVTNLEEIPYVFLFNFLAVLLRAAFPQENL